MFHRCLRFTVIGLLALFVGISCIQDTDGDGFSDDEEAGARTNPADIFDTPQSPIDHDGDGCTDYAEVQAGACDGDPRTVPLAVSISGPTTADVAASIQLRAEVSRPIERFNFAWSIESGLANLANVDSHTVSISLPAAGTVTIRLSVTDRALNERAEVRTTIIIAAPPPPPASSETRFDNLPDSFPTGPNGYTYIGGQWRKTNITYFLANFTSDLDQATQRSVIAEAFATWAQVAPLTFQEVNSAGAADIVIGFGTASHCELYSISGTSCQNAAFDGPGGTLAHCYGPGDTDRVQGDCHFDDGETFSARDGAGGRVSLLSVAIHELGHGLGLGHEPNDRTAIMFPSYDPANIKLQLGADDISGIQSLYGARDGGRAPESPPQPPTGTVPPNDAPNTPTPVDRDGDGLDDSVETFIIRTNPANPDTDDDSLSDGFEVYYQLNPLNPDTDGDQINDGAEVSDGTDPYVPNGPRGTGLAGDYFGYDSAGSLLAVSISNDGACAMVLRIPYGFTYADIPFQGIVDPSGYIQLISYDYYFAFYGVVNQGQIYGEFQTAGGGYGTWFASVNGIFREPLTTEPEQYQPVPDHRVEPTHPVLQRTRWESE